MHPQIVNPHQFVKNSLFQDLTIGLLPITTMSILTFALFCILLASQFPIILESDAWALVSSLLIAVIVTTSILLLGQRHAPLPLFALLLAIHTMLPLSRAVALALAAVVTAAYMGWSIADRVNDERHSHYLQVSGVRTHAVWAEGPFKNKKGRKKVTVTSCCS